MKKRTFLPLSCLLFLLSACQFSESRISTLYTFDQLMWIPEYQGAELKREPYHCKVADQYRFSLMPHQKLPELKNQKTLFSGEYFFYALADLERDLFAEQIHAIDADGAQDLTDESCLFNRYQYANRDPIQILDFLSALTHFDIKKAKNLTSSYENLTPFRILDNCQAITWTEKSESLYGTGFCMGGGGPGVAEFELFVAGEHLYMSYLLDYEKLFDLNILVEE